MTNASSNLTTSHDFDAGLRDIARRRGGEPHAVFADLDWVASPAGGLDLFGAYTDASGRSIELAEAICVTRLGLPVPLYYVPARLAPGFLWYLDHVLVELPGGGLACPVCARPGTIPAVDLADDPDVRLIAAHAHLIRPAVYPADHPDAVAKRAWLRDRAGRN